MTDLVTTPQQRVQDIQRLLRESYGSGFTIFKELVQNAEDAKADRLVLASHAGFAEAQNPLLRAPGLFIANDGPVRGDHWEALKCASGGGKAGDGDAVGRFGLGQKALYHLCDAFAVFGRIVDADGAVRSMVLNPFENIAQASAAGGDWRDPLDPADEALLAQWVQAQGLSQGLALYVPLRTATLRPGPASQPGSTLSLRDRNWTPDEAVEDILDGEQLAATLCCLRRLRQIDIKPLSAPARQFCVLPGANRLSGPTSDDASGPALGGTVTLGKGQIRFHGYQSKRPDGRAAQLQQQPGWPETPDFEGRSIKTKASPHGAAIVCRHPLAPGETARLRAWQAVYLPLGDPNDGKVDRSRLLLIDRELVPGSEHIDIVIHGDFFVTSDRASLRRDDSIESRWNKALLEEVTLPSVLDAVHAALADLADKDRTGLIRSLAKSDWWIANAEAVCGPRALARCRNGGEIAWIITQAAALRPLPEGESTRPVRLKAAWAGFDQWCQQQGFAPAYGTTLSAQAVEWSDAELAFLIGSIGPAAFSDGKITQTLADILDFACPGARLGPASGAALAESLRMAARQQAKAAPLENLKKLTRFLPQEQLFVLPKSVADKELVAVLADVPSSLCVKEEWLADLPPLRELPLREASDLLVALAPLAALKGRQAEQAVTLIAQVLRQGPKLAQLAQDGQLTSLPFFPVVRVANGAMELITPVAAQTLVQRRLLFQTGPANLLSAVAAAVLDPEIFQVRPNLGDLNLELASGNSSTDRCAVVAQVKQFGPAEARAALVKDLGATLDRGLLRRVVAGDPGLKDNITLAELDGLDSVLEPLVKALLGSSHEVRLADPVVAQVLTKAQAQMIELERLDATWLAKELRTRSSALPQMTDEQAMALLTAGVPDADLEPLSLHRAEGRDGLHPAAELVLDRIADVPSKLRAAVHAVRLWDDNAARSVQRRLIKPWSPQRQIAVALKMTHPHQVMAEIAAALAKCPVLDPACEESLKTTAWLAVGEMACRPGEVLTLPQDALEALRGDASGPVPRTLADLPEAVARELERHRLVPDQLQSFAAGLGTLQKAQVQGLAIAPEEHWADLRKLARARKPLGGGSWPFLASALRAFEDDDELARLVRQGGLPTPGRSAVLAQLNDLAMTASEPGQLGEAAARLHKVMFARNRGLLVEPDGFYPADLMLRSEAGGYAAARSLALDAKGTAPEAHVWREYGLTMPGMSGSAGGPSISPPGGYAPLAQVMPQLLEPFRPFLDIHSQVVAVLALLGRSPALRELAESFSPQRTFDMICADLDDCARKTDAPCGTITERLRVVNFRPLMAQDGSMSVCSVAGTACTVSSDGKDEALLVSCGQYREERDPGGQMHHIFPLTLAPVVLRDEDHGARILAAFVQGLAPALMMGATHQRDELARLLQSYREIDQTTLDDTIAELRDSLPNLLGTLKVSDRLHDARAKFRNDTKQRGREEAKSALWQAVVSPDASRDLLDALRRKIRQKGYEPVRALFELFQNAVDAARQAHKKSDLRVEAQRDETGAIVHLRVVHWGRPINVNGPDPDRAFREDHSRDLVNMLVMDHSAKDGPLHGRHGLGFKTVHMLSDKARVACGNLSFEIHGGMLPEPWQEGRDLQVRYNRGRDRATIIDLPIARDCAEAAEEAWRAFVQAAPLLPAMALQEIDCIILCDGDGETELGVEFHQVAQGVSWFSFGAHGDRTALRFDMGDDFALYLPVVSGQPVAFGKDWNRLWNLVPLDGEAPVSAWLIEGPFVIDQGRRGLSGNSAAKPEQFRKLGHRLGRSLVSLYQDWDVYSAAFPNVERDAFFARLIELLADDLDHDGPQRDLHGPGRGLGALLENCPLVPLISGGRALSGEVSWVLSGALCDPQVLDNARPWVASGILDGGVVEPVWAERLSALDLAKPNALNLAAVARRALSNPAVPPELAMGLGGVFNASDQQHWPRQEQIEISQILSQVKLRAEDGSYQLGSALSFPQDPRKGDDGEAERARAAVAPPSGRLCQAYSDRAVDFAQLVRSAVGYREQTLHQWLRSAHEDEARALAALRYLAGRPGEITRLSQHLPWLPQGDALLQYPPFQKLDSRQQAHLRIGLGNWQTPAYPDSQPAPVSYSPRDVLYAIAEWWEADRDQRIADYEHAVYPEPDLFDPRQLADHRDEDWFTMFGLAVSQTLGRVQPEQSRNFVQQALREGWWHELASVGPHDTELRPFVDRLLAWSEPDDREQFMIWRRCLVDLCRIARHLDDYRALFRAFPGYVTGESRRVSLTNFIQPQFSTAAGRIAPNAVSISRSLGIGANWIVRELGRCGYYDREQAKAVLPYGWGTAARVRELLQRIGLPEMEHGVDAGWFMHGQVAQCMGMDNPFGEDGDLPLHVITLTDYRDDYNAILQNCII